jgi:hypothetical protein
LNRDKIEQLKFVQKLRQKTMGIDVYSLAIGEQKETKDDKMKLEDVKDLN